MRNFLIICFFILCTFNSFSQEKEKITNIRKIGLELISAKRIPYNKVSVDLKYIKKKVTIKVRSIPKYDKKEWSYSKIDTSFILKFNDFLKIKKSLKKINANNFLIDSEFSFRDGNKSILKFGGFGSEISYSFRSPYFRTKERNLATYLDSCILILKMAGFNDEKIKLFLNLESVSEVCE